MTNLENLVQFWPQYEEIRKSGRYNMFMEGRYAAAEMGIDLDTYFYVLSNYSQLKEMYYNSI